jgi:hypothetical protein
MKMIDSQHKGNKKKKLIFIPRANGLHMIVNKTYSAQGTKIKKEIHKNKKYETRPKADSNGNAC